MEISNTIFKFSNICDSVNYKHYFRLPTAVVQILLTYIFILVQITYYKLPSVRYLKVGLYNKNAWHQKYLICHDTISWFNNGCQKSVTRYPVHRLNHRSRDRVLSFLCTPVVYRRLPYFTQCLIYLFQFRAIASFEINLNHFMTRLPVSHTPYQSTAIVLKYNFKQKTNGKSINFCNIFMIYRAQ